MRYLQGLVASWALIGCDPVAEQQIEEGQYVVEQPVVAAMRVWPISDGRYEVDALVLGASELREVTTTVCWDVSAEQVTPDCFQGEDARIIDISLPAVWSAGKASEEQSAGVMVWATTDRGTALRAEVVRLPSSWSSQLQPSALEPRLTVPQRVIAGEAVALTVDAQDSGYDTFQWWVDEGVLSQQGVTHSRGWRSGGVHSENVLTVPKEYRGWLTVTVVAQSSTVEVPTVWTSETLWVQ